MIFGFFLFYTSLLPVMSYLTLSSQEKPLFQKIIPSRHLLYSVRAFARIRQTLCFSKYWGDGCMGRHPHLKFGGTVPPAPLGLRPRIYRTNNLKNVRLSCICC